MYDEKEIKGLEKNLADLPQFDMEYDLNSYSIEESKSSKNSI